MIDKLKGMGNKVVSKIKDSIQQSKEKKDKNLRLKDWQDKFGTAFAGVNLTIRDEREMIYLGTADVDKNINLRNQPSQTKRANNVVNLVLEFIETNVDATIPQPSVRSKLPGWEEHATMIEDSLTADITELDMTAINDTNERITPIQGYSAILVGWDPDLKHHLYRGELTIESIHPKRIIPQPGVWKLQKMDYFFILSSVTKTFIKKRYDVDLESMGDQFPSFNTITGNEPQLNSEIVTEVVCWYKDEKTGEVGRFAWCDDEILEDLPNYYARRIDGNTVTEEILESDITLSSGEVLRAGTKVPIFMPTRYPLVIRENIPLNFAFGGQSDVDVIRDQQDAMKKVVSTIEEKIVRGGAVITALEGHRLQLTNELYSIIRGNQAELNALSVKNLAADISQDLAFAQQQYEAARSTLGITNTWQGKADSTAVSGVAKQIQVQQTGGRLRSKEANKYAAFKEMFEIIFEFKLAFYGELRPFVTKDAEGKDSYGNFNKYAFLVRDKAGELYYNTDFIFNADAGAGLPRDKMWLFNSIQELLKYGAYNPSPAAVNFWTQMVQQKYPNAKIILDSINKQLEQQSQKPDIVPKATITYKDLSPDAQAQMLEKVGINVQDIPQQPLEEPQQPQGPSVQPQGQLAQPQPTQGQQGQPQQDIISQVLAQLPPEKREVFLSLPEEQQQALLQQIMGGGQGG